MKDLFDMNIEVDEKNTQTIKDKYFSNSTSL